MTPKPPRGAAWIAVALTLGFLLLVLVLPVAQVFLVAFSRGGGAFLRAILRPDTLAALRLTVLVVSVVVPLNSAFGLAVAFAVVRCAPRGRALLLLLLDIPFSVSPVVTGLLFVLLFGSRGALGPWLLAHDVRVIYTPVGMVLVTLFITLPLVARELIPLLMALGTDEEQAAASLGASPAQVFLRVTLPGLRWGLLSGVIICGARSLGEFGAVSVVSGHIRGETNTLPLQVEILYNEYDQVGAFAAASLLCAAGLIALIIKKVAEARAKHEERRA